MKHEKSLLFVFSFLILFWIVACTPQTKTQQPTGNNSALTTPVAPVGETQVSATSEKPQTATTPTVDVDALIREKLQNHHDISRIFNAKKTREEWNATLDRMIGYGANISEEEKKIMIDYLLSK
jgi:hypothetical protein